MLKEIHKTLAEQLQLIATQLLSKRSVKNSIKVNTLYFKAQEILALIPAGSNLSTDLKTCSSILKALSDLQALEWPVDLGLNPLSEINYLMALYKPYLVNILEGLVEKLDGAIQKLNPFTLTGIEAYSKWVSNKIDVLYLDIELYEREIAKLKKQLVLQQEISKTDIFSSGFKDAANNTEKSIEDFSKLKESSRAQLNELSAQLREINTFTASIARVLHTAKVVRELLLNLIAKPHLESTDIKKIITLEKQIQDIITTIQSEEFQRQVANYTRIAGSFLESSAAIAAPRTMPITATALRITSFFATKPPTTLTGYFHREGALVAPAAGAGAMPVKPTIPKALGGSPAVVSRSLLHYSLLEKAPEKPQGPISPQVPATSSGIMQHRR